ncbi:MAG: lysine--tRNA ligase [Clostridiales bacterium]|jgi:lysyl-tRNA synthetase class 2|nr:lysine--tRNA ligase [Clostridiales bacterium]
MSENTNNNNNAVNENITPETLAESIQIRREKLRELIDAGKNPYEETVYAKNANAAEILSDYEKYAERSVSVAGRIISRRIMGKASFCHILDGSGSIQIYLKADELGETYEDFKRWDIGDIVGASGAVFTTHKGEISVRVTEIKLLSKSLLPLPEKYHGLKDPDLRYRQRYVDLIANPEVKNTFIARSGIIRAIREFLDGEGYLEVETPILNTIAGGAEARPFVTHHNTLDLDMYLRIAPELYLKRLIVGGFERVYEMGRLFRNEGMSIRHNPEFTTVELYAAYSDYNDMMTTAEKMIEFTANKVLGTTEIVYQGTPINLGAPWKRMTMVEAVREIAGIDCEKESLDKLKKLAKTKGIDLKADTSWGAAVYALFDNLVEDKLIQPTFITEYPVEISPLAKKKKTDKTMTERFEIFIYGRELGNAYSELNDPIDQKQRFADQMKKREKGDEEAHLADNDFVTALEYGMPPTGGMGIGIDRLVMFLTDSTSIRDVLLFPTMKPVKN